jgi:hypothetical protein
VSTTTDQGDNTMKETNMPPVYVKQDRPNLVVWGGLFKHELVERSARTERKFLRLSEGSGGAMCISLTKANLLGYSSTAVFPCT